MAKTKTNVKATVITIVSIIAFLLIVGGAFFAYNHFKSDDKKVDIKNSGIQIEGLYGADGKPINTGAQATVGGVSGVAFITLKVIAVNKDTVPLNFKILGAQPSAFEAKLSTSPVTADAGSTASWISDLIDIRGLEGTDQVFTVTVEGSSDKRQTASKTYEVTIPISEDPASNFDIEITDTAGNDPYFGEPPECSLDEHCTGDYEICLNGECIRDPEAPECSLTSECPSGQVCESGDCVTPEPPAPSPDKVKFRTTDLGYISGTAVAYSATCGSPLTAYGRTSGACTEYWCDSSTGYIEVPASGAGIVKSRMWIKGADLCICQTDKINVHTVASRYATSDTDASKVSTSLDPQNPANEITC